ncbi:hypothetical protein [Aquimarina algicola]|uniref:Uncharacterized protein n=1 Tax=Aquimarina algicola TaxID=2589995 RepID=A0A504JHU1_9FLAO|nr:hypothetical protein [Aquimarina algicola]TPN87223.1 hypothetical protein FHK87_06445 [Aquimarina algicola]
MKLDTEKSVDQLGNTKKKIKLVEGVFSPVDAADVLLSLIADKIRHHNCQIISVKERFNEDTSHSEQRVLELKEEKNKIKDIIIKARDEGYEIKINGTIEIELVK